MGPVLRALLCWNSQETSQGSSKLQGALAERGAEEPDRRGVVKSSTWSGVCTVILVACVLVFLLGIVLHNMSCISKRFTVISCG